MEGNVPLQVLSDTYVVIRIEGRKGTLRIKPAVEEHKPSFQETRLKIFFGPKFWDPEGLGKNHPGAHPINRGGCDLPDPSKSEFAKVDFFNFFSRGFGAKVSSTSGLRQGVGDLQSFSESPNSTFDQNHVLSVMPVSYLRTTRNRLGRSLARKKKFPKKITKSKRKLSSGFDICIV